ncbi:MAG TPA: hypothetical protein VGB73_09930 [Pyrinomonadaceae bacterium]|jgi:hypothetical protein
MSDPKIKSGTQTPALPSHLQSHAQPTGRQAATAKQASVQARPPKPNEAADNRHPAGEAARTNPDQAARQALKDQRVENPQRQQQKKNELPAQLRELEARDARVLRALEKQTSNTTKVLRHQEHPQTDAKQQNKADRHTPNGEAHRNGEAQSQHARGGGRIRDDAPEHAHNRGASVNRHESNGRGNGNNGSSEVKLKPSESPLPEQGSQLNSTRRELAQLRREARASERSLLDYLKGDKKSVENLPTHLREVLEGTTRAVGNKALRALNAASSQQLEKYVEKFSKKFNRTLEGALARGETPKAIVREAVRELSSVVRIVRHLANLEKTGGEVVRRAEERIFNFLGRQLEGRGGASTPQERVRASELWRDLRSGAFQPTPDAHNPYPLTGRARIASEMMELMHTLDAIERAWQKLGGRAQGGAQPGVAEEGGLFPGQAGATLGADGEAEALLSMLPTLPGRAARAEIARFIAALNGQLFDAKGRTLVAPDGTPLRLDQLLLLGTQGGLFGGIFEADHFPTRLSPLLIYGFDALYSLIGFDGRTLNAPRYAAVQVQINASELESMFGQQPLSEGWMRALIERLKDSLHADHNLLGEMLEMALADGRLYTVLLSGSVNEGVAAENSFSVAKLLPGGAGELAGLAPA